MKIFHGVGKLRFSFYRKFKISVNALILTSTTAEFKC